MQMTQVGQLRALLLVTVNSMSESSTAFGAGSVRFCSSFIRMDASCAMLTSLFVVAASSCNILCKLDYVRSYEEWHVYIGGAHVRMLRLQINLQT